MPRKKKEAETALVGEGQQMLVDQCSLTIQSNEVGPVIEGTTGGENKVVLYWRPPVRKKVGRTSRVEKRGELLTIEQVVVGVNNLTKSKLYYAVCFPGIKGKEQPKSQLNQDGVLGAYGETDGAAVYQFTRSDLLKFGIRLRNLYSIMDVSGLGTIKAELVRLVEFQFEHDDHRSPTPLPIASINIKVFYRAKSFEGPVMEECFYKEYIERGEPLGLLERSEEPCETTQEPVLCHLPDEGYREIGFDLRSQQADSTIKLAWFQGGKYQAPFRWREIEDEDTRFVVPALIAAQYSNYPEDWWTTCLGNMEWGFNADDGVWNLVQADGTAGEWEVRDLQEARRFVGSMVPVIVYDRREPKWDSGVSNAKLTELPSETQVSTMTVR